MSANYKAVTRLSFENAGLEHLDSGIVTFGQVFARNELSPGIGLTAKIDGKTYAVQVDVKTTYDDGSIKMAVLSVERPGLNPSSSVEAVLQTAPTAAHPAAVNLSAALAQHDFTVDISTGGKTTHIDVLSALKAALADGSAIYWQNGPLATQARVEIDLPGSQRMVFDVTAFKGGGLAVEAQFNNDGAMGSAGSRVAYDLVARLDGKVVAQESVSQGQYENWHESFSTTDHDGGQGLGSAETGWLNIRHDIAHLQATGAVAHYDLTVDVADTLLDRWEAAYTSPTWDDPLSTRSVSQYMPGTGGREDIGITTAGNTAWLVSQDIRAATYALGQAEAASVVPWNLWDSANNRWLSTDEYPHLWTDGRGGTGTPGDSDSRGLTQQGDNQSGWTLDSAHQPDLSYVPYLLTGERWMLDNLQAQGAWNVLNTWSDVRGQDGNIVVDSGQVRHSAWALRQIDKAAWASPEGSVEKSYFTEVSKANWAWLVEQIPAWTAAQGEAHGWVPGDYGTAGALPPWQQDYFASTTIAAAAQGNADALTFLEWQSNFLIGRFTHEAQGFAQHDGAAYLIAMDDPATGTPYTTWSQIGAHTAANGWSNGEGWQHSQGDYVQLALATLAGIAHLTGSAAAAAAYAALMADAPPFTSSSDFAQGPTNAIAPPGSGLPASSAPPTIPDTSEPSPPVAVPAPSGSSTTIGAGKDALVLKVSEQAWNGDAQFTVKVDGVQVGGILTAKASHAAGVSDTFTLKGDWGSAAHKIEVNFVNDAWNGNLVEDRNLYLDGVTYNGKAVASSTVDMRSGGVVKLDVPVTAAPAPAGSSTTVGAGKDVLVVKVSEQAWNGDAQFTVKVDGVQVGGTLTAKASHAAGVSDTFTLKGNWGGAAHKVEVNFVNDDWNGNLVEDRNLYLDGVTYNGKAVASSTVDMLSGGVVKLDVPVTAAPSPAQSGISTTVGAGRDALVLKVSEQAWNGDAQFTVKVDGVQVGGTLTAKASHAAGVSDTFTLKGNWGGAAHKVEVNFVNDDWNGNLVEDRNLYLDGVTYNGKAVASSTVDMLSGGAVVLSVPQSVINGDASANTITGTDFADYIRGLAGNDTLSGGGGDDTLDGGAGSDLMFGGAGNDSFGVDNARDVPTELAGGGYDTVTASLSWTLGANLERLKITGTATDATGNELDNLLIGNNLANRLNGMAGRDRLQGGDGKDVLTGGQGADILEGGAGSDSFRYTRPAEGGDSILDFVSREDVIEISASGFGGGLSTSTSLAPAARFVTNTTGLSTAPAGTGQFIYETDAAKLWWDADGSGAGVATGIATFAAGTNLAYGDIHLIG